MTPGFARNVPVKKFLMETSLIKILIIYLWEFSKE